MERFRRNEHHHAFRSVECAYAPANIDNTAAKAALVAAKMGRAATNLEHADAKIDHPRTGIERVAANRRAFHLLSLARTLLRMGSAGEPVSTHTRARTRELPPACRESRGSPAR
eukprot:5803793-Pleurochrysis_carterae.AAC.1